MQPILRQFLGPRSISSLQYSTAFKAVLSSGTCPDGVRQLSLVQDKQNCFNMAAMLSAPDTHFYGHCPSTGVDFSLPLIRGAGCFDLSQEAASAAWPVGRHMISMMWDGIIQHAPQCCGLLSGPSCWGRQSEAAGRDPPLTHLASEGLAT